MRQFATMILVSVFCIFNSAYIAQAQSLSMSGMLQNLHAVNILSRMTDPDVNYVNMIYSEEDNALYCNIYNLNLDNSLTIYCEGFLWATPGDLALIKIDAHRRGYISERHPDNVSAHYSFENITRSEAEALSATYDIVYKYSHSGICNMTKPFRTGDHPTYVYIEPDGSLTIETGQGEATGL